MLVPLVPASTICLGGNETGRKIGTRQVSVLGSEQAGAGPAEEAALGGNRLDHSRHVAWPGVGSGDWIVAT